MGRYIKAQSIQCHYNFDPDCTACHGTGKGLYDLPCMCGVENMTFDEPEDVLMTIEAEPLPDGGMRIHLQGTKPETN